MPDDSGPGRTAFPDDRSGPTPIPATPRGASLPPGAALAPAPSGAPGPALSSDPESSPSVPPASVPPVNQVRRTRTSTTYAGIGVGLLVLIVVLIFVVQNLHESSVHFITLHFRLPQGVIVLAAAVAGGLIVLLVSLARVVQLRLAARRTRHASANR